MVRTLGVRDYIAIVLEFRFCEALITQFSKECP
jgi:hypothetical protein